MLQRIALLPTAYLPPIQYFSKLANYARIRIEQHDHYSKQTYRNRCHILGPNGVQHLSVPVHKTFGNDTKLKDIRIDYDKQWQLQHWRAIHTAYRSSPYFLHYAPVLEDFYRKKYRFLLDWNTDLLLWLIRCIDLDVVWQYTQEFVSQVFENIEDYREVIHPKPQFRQPDPLFEAPYYTQVFSDKMPFQKNLSIIDLLFMEGPRTKAYLKRSMPK